MSLIDVLLIAPLGESAIAALGVASALMAFFTGIQFALASGSQLVIARYCGAGNLIGAAKAVLAGGLINGLVSMLMLVGLLLGLPSLLAAIIHNAAVEALAQTYMTVMMWVLIPSSLSQVMMAYYNGFGKTRIPLQGFLLEIPINIGVSIVLIYGYLGFDSLGLVGAAIGSLVAVTLRLLYLSWRLSRDPIATRLRPITQLSRSTISLHFKEIAPIAANFITLRSGVLVYQVLFAQLDVYAYAAITLVLPWVQMGANVVAAWSHATAINVSQFLGHNDTRSIPGFITQAIRISLVLAVCLSLAFLCLSLALPGLYPDMHAQTLQALVIIAPIYILLPLVRTYNGLCGTTLRALGQSFGVLRVHFVTQWLVGIPLLAFLVFQSAPLLLVFGVMLLEESLKVVFFRRNIQRTLHTIDQPGVTALSK